MAESKQPAPQSANFPLFYSKPEPLESTRHKNLALKKDFGLKFSSGANAVPINMIEFSQICHFYPIAFAPDEKASPVAILGLRDSENLFLNSKGDWLSESYIPAYLRRYPFIFSEQSGGDQLTLCVDAADAVTEKASDQRFFDEDGTPSALSKNALEFCKSYHSAAIQTQNFCKALVDANLLVERSAEIAVPGGQKINFSGFRIIDEQKFAALDEKTFLDFRNKGYLPFIYAHLFSGAQWVRLTRMLGERMKKKAA